MLFVFVDESISKKVVPMIDETKIHVNMTQYADIIREINHIKSLFSGNPAVQHTAPHPSPHGVLPKKRSKSVTIDPAFAPPTENLYPPTIGFEHEPNFFDHQPFEVVPPIGDDSINFNRYVE